jgi:hypothetical protein
MRRGHLIVMAVLAVGLVAMVKGRVLPAFRIVTVVATAREVNAGRCVARGTIAQAIVGDPYLLPGCGEVAIATVTGVMIIWPVLTVAFGAVGLACVVKFYALPGCGQVAAAALTGIMAGV